MRVEQSTSTNRTELKKTFRSTGRPTAAQQEVQRAARIIQRGPFLGRVFLPQQKRPCCDGFVLHGLDRRGPPGASLEQKDLGRVALWSISRIGPDTIKLVGDRKRSQTTAESGADNHQVERRDSRGRRDIHRAAGSSKSG